MKSDELEAAVRRFVEGLPAAFSGARQELETHFRAALHAGLEKLELTTRHEFDVQTRLLERARERVDQLEKRLAELEKRLEALEEGGSGPA